MEKVIQEFQEGLLWKIEEGSSLVIGVTQSAIDQAGTVAEMDISDSGDEFEAGDWIAEIRGKDSVVDIVAPCALRITERNEELLSQPALVEDDPTGDAWILRAERIDE
jgi:glycine cleavage system H protein